jgi:hypothetical protein
MGMSDTATTSTATADSAPRRSLMTPLGVASGDVLSLVEARGSASLTRVLHELQQWPVPLVLMAVGALIREGLVLGTGQGWELVLERLSA